MLDLSIDCSTFLLLTGAEIGKYGDYWIDEEGVRGCMDTTPDRLKLLESHEQAWLVEFNRDARLEFPVSASRLIQWSNDQAGEVPLPKWFLSAAASDSAAQALSVLDKEKHALESRLGRPKDALSSFEAEDEGSVDIADVIGELNAVQYMMKLLMTSPDGDGSHKKRRSDPLARDISEALKLLPPGADAERVMRLLQTWAGKSGSCVVEAIPQGLIWNRVNGSAEKLTVEMLRKRMSRIRSRNRKPTAAR